MEDVIKLEIVDDAIAHVILCDPKGLNLENLEMAKILDQKQEEISKNNKIRVVVVRSSVANFSAGAALQFLKDVNNLKTDISSGSFGGLINIVASSIPGTYLLPRMIAKVQGELPDLRFRIDILNSREAIESIKQGDADIGFVGKEIKHQSLQFKKIFEDEIVLISHPDLKPISKIEEIRDIPLITRENGSGTKTITETHLQEQGILPSELNIVMECSTSEGMREAVINKLGYAFISNIAIEKDLTLKNLSIIKIKNFTIKRNFYVVTSRARSLTDKATSFVDHLYNLS